MAEKRLAGRLALVTGASRGIGAAVARRFAAEGAHIVAVARTVGALEELDDDVRKLGGAATLVPLDLADFVKIDQMAAALYERFGRLDILVGNAAILGTLTPMAQIRPEEWSRVLDLNLTANWRLIRAMDPLLRLSEAGRAVFVTSGVARSVSPYWGSYAVSKAALEMMVKVWAGEVAKTKLRVNLVDPGVVRTKMRAAAFPGENPETLNPPEAVTDLLVELAAAECTRHGEVLKSSEGRAQQ
jgi:NAD(P)-dependent dehydrogenase (short-subunit alcohol dehydrogenase family)